MHHMNKLTHEVDTVTVRTIDALAAQNVQHAEHVMKRNITAPIEARSGHGGAAWDFPSLDTVIIRQCIGVLEVVS